MAESASDKYTVKLNRVVAASTEEAFDAFTRPDLLSQWFTESAKVDLRVGGRYSNSDKDQGEFLVVERPSKVQFTWENQEHCPNTIVDIRFRRDGESAVEVMLEHRDIGDEPGYRDMRTGWSWALDSFKSFMEEGKPISFEAWEREKQGAE